MIIQTIRLKNIKSYGEGTGGEGVTVVFQPGVNCVAGKNGHGKTTLVEALGYALFLTEPEREERFNIDIYFLRAGETDGEIDVTFTHDGAAYRLERGVGRQSKRRSKIVDLCDGSICAEDREVDTFLCALFGLKDPKQLAEIFSKLIGVKQGRLAWPFDSAAKDAKEFFEPLLDVAVFRECAERLGEAQRRFDALLGEQNVNLSTAEERIRERSDSPDKLPARRQQVENLHKAVEASRQDHEKAEAHKQLHEQKEKSFTFAKSAVEQARNQFALASHARETAKQRVNESLDAAETINREAPAYEACLRAERQLRELQQQQNEKSRLQSRRAEAANAKAVWEGKMAAARQQAAEHKVQETAAVEQARVLRRQIGDGREVRQQTLADFDALSQTTAAAKKSWAALLAWKDGLDAEVEDNAKLLVDILKDWEKIRTWEPQSVLKARAEEQQLDHSARQVEANLTGAQREKDTLSAQLKQISGGICPFLEERCRQFDPKAIQSDLGDREKVIKDLEKQRKEAAKAYQEARRALELLSDKEAALAELKNSLRGRVELFVERHQRVIPAAIQRHFSALEGCFPEGCKLSRVLPPAGVRREGCWDESGAMLDSALLHELAAARKAFVGTVKTALEEVGGELEGKFNQFEKQRVDRLRQERDLENAGKNLARVEAEGRALAQKIAQLTEAATAAEMQASTATGVMSELDEKLKAFAMVEQAIREQQEIKDRHTEGHRLYLGAKQLADQLAIRQEALKKPTDIKAQAREQAQSKVENFEHAAREFDPAALVSARKAASGAEIKLAMDKKASEDSERHLEEERERFRQWQEACLERDRIGREMGRLRAAGGLAKLAASVLKLSAPAVAQHLCSRIAANAQRIFNRINQEAIELEWKAEPQYGLRIVPGERRFAMLSGGEQTKLAVAMTLAMIQEFSALRFAVFDEPTYAVDADSRPKLADAILEAQEVAGLDQLIIVSHDDAFEGRVENVVVLRKLAGSGTELLNSPPLQPPVRP